MRYAKNASVILHDMRALRLVLVFSLIAPLPGCFLFRHPPTYTAPRLIGLVTAATGSPFVIRHGETYIIGVQSRIYEGDIIETNDASKTRIEMIDQSTIQLGAGSHCVFHRYDFTAGDRAPVAALTITSGSMRIATAGQIPGRHSSFQLRTPLATVALHGGDIWSGFTFGAQRLDVALFEGDGATVSNDHGSVDVELPGYGTTVLAGGAPQQPIQWSKRKLSLATNTASM